MTQSPWFLRILAAKFVLILGLAANSFGWLKFGEAMTIAADDGSLAKAEEKPANEAPPAGDSQQQQQQQSSELDDLITLPAIDPKKIEKEQVGRYFVLLDRKAKQIAEKIRSMQEQERKLAELEKGVTTKIKQLDDERRFFADTLQKEKVVQEDRLAKLTELYKKMEPKKAGPIFEQMDKDLAVALFKAIAEKQTRAILEAMQPAKSVELTEYFGRVRSTREYEILAEMNRSLLASFEACKATPENPELQSH